LGGGPPCFPQGFTCLVVLWIPATYSIRFVYGTFTLCGESFHFSSTTNRLRFCRSSTPMCPQCGHIGLGSSPFARRYSGNRFFFLFLRILRCFSSPGISSITYVFSNRYLRFALSRFPHSEIPGSKLVCSYPRLIAAYHVLHRLLVPRHPPSALISLTCFVSSKSLLLI